MSQPLFTIATITYNSSKYVRQTIESVLASTFEDFEYLISDDCSTDDTWAIIQEYSDSRIKAWRNEVNLGEYPNRNKVLLESIGKYILFIDGDDILYKNAMSEYVNYIHNFPDAKAIWGVYSLFFDFVVFPYMLSPYQLTSINFLSTYPLTVVGFTDSVFAVSELKELGGFDTRFAIGDTYIKRKFSCYYPVLLVPAGRAFWRQYPEQASNKARFFYRNLTDSYTIDKEILNSTYIPLEGAELEQARENFRIRSIKLLILNTIRKGKVLDFFKLMYRLLIPYSDLRFLFKKGDYTYKAGATSSNPLINNFNF